jgi:diguanylate cyclase (GGDEF)-like protein
MPRWILALLGPAAVALIAYLGAAPVLYVFPVLAMTLWFGRRGAGTALVCVTAAQIWTGGGWTGPLAVIATMAGLALVLLAHRARHERLLARLEGEARTDALTGLLNRRGFDERAALELMRSRRQLTPMAVCAFDIDHFKRVNDEWGHDVGDRVLARTGRVIAANSRDIDIVARFGGEEFVVLVPGADVGGAHSYAERVRTALAAEATGDLPVVHVSAGVHAAVAPNGVEVLLQAADAALYQAKRAGRNRTVICDRITAATVAA